MAILNYKINLYSSNTSEISTSQIITKLFQFISICLVLLVSIRVLRAYLDPLRKQPGPLLARFTRLWYLKKVARGDFEKTNQALHAHYGKIVRIAPNEYSIDDPESLKIIYGHNTGFMKSKWYIASGNPDPNTHDLFTDLDPNRHAALRRKVAHLYSMTNLVQYEPLVETCTRQLLEQFDKFAREGVVFNMQSWLQYYAFDLIGMITFNEKFGFLSSGADENGMFEALDAYLGYSANVGIYSEWHQVLSRLVALLPSPGASYLHSFVQEQVNKRVSSTSADKTSARGADFLSKLMETRETNPEKIGMKEVFLSCLTNIGAGSDTTSISLSAIVYYLLCSPDSMQKLRNEIERETLSQPTTDLITFKTTQSMMYLQACIREGLRLHPATGLPLGRVVPQGGATLNGVFFPQGTVVGVNTWVAHRNKDVYGQDANSFRPERWMEPDSGRLSLMEKSYMPFGLGSRTCIGKNISMLEISKLIPELVKRYDIELADGGIELQTQNKWFVKQKNLNCRIRRRAV